MNSFIAFSEKRKSRINYQINIMKKLFSLLVISLFLLLSSPAEARKKDRGNNYIENGHLFVWHNNDYVDMGPYHP